MVRGVEEGTAGDGRRYVHAETRAALRRWLTTHQDDGAGAWFASWKKATGRPAVPYDELVEELLCVGWVDATAGSLDDDRGMLWCAPRKKGSGWARTNKERVERLEAAGLLLPRGVAVIEQARADGSWTALDASENLETPADLMVLLEADPPARAAYGAWPPSVRKQAIAWITTAKRDETRARRVEAVHAAAREGRRPF